MAEFFPSHHYPLTHKDRTSIHPKRLQIYNYDDEQKALEMEERALKADRRGKWMGENANMGLTKCSRLRE